MGHLAAWGGANKGGRAGKTAAGRGWGGGGRSPSGSRFTEQRDATARPAAVQGLRAGGGRALDGGTDVGGGFQRLP